MRPGQRMIALIGAGGLYLVACILPAFNPFYGGADPRFQPFSGGKALVLGANILIHTHWDPIDPFHTLKIVAVTAWMQTRPSGSPSGRGALVAGGGRGCSLG